MYFIVFSVFFLCNLILPVAFVYYTILIVNYGEVLLVNASDAFVNTLIGDDPRSTSPHSPPFLCRSWLRVFRSLRSLCALLTQTFAFFYNCHAELDYDAAFDGGFFSANRGGNVDDYVVKEEKEQKEQKEEDEEEKNEEEETGFQTCNDERNIMYGNDVNNGIKNADRPEPRKVDFDRVHIREYQVVQCQHARTKGVSLTLGDRHLGTNTVDLDNYEASKVRRGVNQLSFTEKVERLWEMGELFKVGEGAIDQSTQSRKGSFDRVQIRESPFVRDEKGELDGWARNHTKMGVVGVTEIYEVAESDQAEGNLSSRSALLKGRMQDVVDWSDTLPELFEVNGSCELGDFGLTLETRFRDKTASKRKRERFWGSVEIVEAGELTVMEKECSNASLSI